MNASFHNDCERLMAHIQSALDGDCALARDPHLENCADCGARFAAAKALAAWVPEAVIVPAGFADRVMARVSPSEVAGARWDRKIFFAVAALAASVVVIVGLSWPKAKPEPVQPLAAVAKASPPVSKPITEAREAFASLGNHAVKESLAPAANLFAVSPKPVSYSVSPIEVLPAAAKAGVEPLASSPKRAFNRFVNDVSKIAGAKPK